jgi:hypothetical protein
MPFEHLEHILNLVGVGEPHITFLKGGQWGPERTIGVFKGGAWTLYTDGTFLFQPPLVADVRDDLYPIQGTCTLVNGILEFQGMQQSESGTASSALDGTMKMRYGTVCLDVIHTVASSMQQIVRVTQMLSSKLIVEDQPAPFSIAGFYIPLVYSIVLAGNVDGNTFGPLNGSLKLLPPGRADSNPFRLELTTEYTRSTGSLFWTSFLQYLHGQGLQCSKITICEDDQVILETLENVNPVSPSWFTTQVVPAIGQIMQGVTGEQGQLAISPRAEHLSGTIHAKGTSDLGQNSIYQAQILGQILNVRV